MTATPQTPLVVRIVSSALLSCAVAVLSTDLPKNMLAIIMVTCVAVGIMVIYTHPYRKQVQQFLASHNVKPQPRLTDMLPVIVVWIALLLVPVFAPAPWWLTTICWLGIFAWMWIVFPIIDGTRSLRRLAS